MLLRATIAEYAPDQSATASAAAAETQTATCGLLKRGETEASAAEKGSPPSRANANSMRELEVTLERPQNHIAAMAIHTSAEPVRPPSAPRSAKMNGLSAAAVAPRPPRESVTARRSAEPATPLTATASPIPHVAVRCGAWCSSHP